MPDGVARSAAIAAAARAGRGGVAWSVLLNAGAGRGAAAAAGCDRATPVPGGGARGRPRSSAFSRDASARDVDRQYDAFVALNAKPSSESGASRLVSGARQPLRLLAHRLGGLEAAPARGGVGAGNYDGPYFERRATTEDIRQPHSLPLQALSELGVIGAGLLAVFLIGIGWGAWRTARAARASAGARFVAVAGIGTVSAWFVHTSVDWIHLLPGVTAVALVAAALLVRHRG